MKKYEEGKIYQAEVTCVENYGAFVKLDDDYTGLIHVSEISHFFVKSIDDYVKIGDQINVKVIGVYEKKKQLSLSIKNIKYKKSNQKKIEETQHGFLTLKANLPIWIEKKIKKIEKIKISLDK
mgnify:CR=1 FL=1